MTVYELRPPVAVSLGCHLEGVALPHSDPKDVITSVVGAQKRFMTKPPPYDPAKLNRLRVFVRKWCRENLQPLAPDVDTSVETWLASCNYPEWRKKELLEKYKRMTHIRDPQKRYLACKSFIKDETYPGFKHSRIINSRTDEFKCVVGPIFRLIEKEVFKHKEFIKKIPIHLRPHYIREHLFVEGSDYDAADYISFESLFIEEIMDSVEFEMYDYMVSGLAEGQPWLELIRDALMGMNECEFKDFILKVRATRMSGEMNTSLGNGFCNLMVIKFLAEENGCKAVDCVVEGDDSAARYDGPSPTVADFAALGLNCKIDRCAALEEMSFCGLVFDKDDLINVTNPLEVLASFGWSSQTYVRANSITLKKLLRCKALSMAHQYPGCPIISALAQYGLRVTRSIDIRHFAQEKARFNQWERDQLLAALSDEGKIKVVEPPMNTRFLVEKLYGIPVSEQRRIEEFLDGLDVLTPIPVKEFCINFPTEWEDYFQSYVRRVDIKSRDLCNPAGFTGGIERFIDNVNPTPDRASWSDRDIRR
jgi:hypothetical protein